MIFSEDEIVIAKHFYLRTCDMSGMVATENILRLMKLMKLVILSSLIVSRLKVNTIIFRKYEDSTDESLSGCHETSSSVFKF